MRKRGLVVLMLACLAVTGCRKAIDVDSIEHNNDTASTDYDDTYVEPEEDYIEEEEYEGEEEEIPDSPAEVEGIVGMLHRVSPSRAMTDIQLFTIDPQTGAQKIIAEWYLKNPASTTSDSSELHFYIPNKSRVYGNNRDWLSDDFTMLGATAVFDNNERHAGWVDYNGEFFDVTNSIGAVQESSFSNPNPIIQSSLGFQGDQFAFYEESAQNDRRHYYVPIANVSNGAVREVDISDWYFNEAFVSAASDEFYPTAWIDENTCIADIYDNVGCPQSVCVNIGSGEMTQYLPDSERYNWSGVLSPDGTTVAFLSVPQRADGVVEIYTVPLSGGEPAKVEYGSADTLLEDITTLTQDDLYGPTSLRTYEECHFYLLGWK